MKSSALESSLQLLNHTETRTAILENLGLLDHHAVGQTIAINDSTVLAEILRTSLWAWSSCDNSVQMQPVHVTRLLNSAKSLVQRTSVPRHVEDSPSTNGDQNEELHLELRQLMDELEDTGDIARLPRGFWLPSPFRMIPLPTIARWLLVGGIPTSLLSHAVHAACEYSGAARLLNRSPSELGLPDFIQTKEDWCQVPREPADSWAQEVLRDVEIKPFEASDTHYDYYAPGILRTRRSDLQYFRWTDNMASLPNGRFLMRHRTSFGPVYYSIAEIKNRTIIGTASLDSFEGSIRRLQYGLDKLSGFPVSLRVNYQEDGYVSYTLKNELPAAENRLFLTLGRLKENANGSYYPKIWQIAKGYASEADSAIEHLRIAIVCGQKR